MMISKYVLKVGMALGLFVDFIGTLMLFWCPDKVVALKVIMSGFTTMLCALLFSCTFDDI